MTDDSKEEEASSHCSVSAVSVIFGDREGGLHVAFFFSLSVFVVGSTSMS